EDFLLRLLRYWQFEKVLGGVRLVRVPVRVVRRPHDVVVADLLYHLLEAALFLGADEALPTRVRARLHRQGRGVPVGQTLEVVIDAIEPERHPAGVAFQQGDAQARKGLQNPADDQAQAGVHHGDRVRGYVHHDAIRPELVAWLPNDRASALVETY